MNTGSPSQTSSRNRADLIREQAHAIWLERGQPDGQDLEHWMEAERRLGPEAPQSLLEENTSVLGENPATEAPDRKR